MICLSFVFSIDKIPKIKICHMEAKEHPEFIKGRRRLIDVDVLYYEEASEEDNINNYDAAFDEEDGSDVVGAGIKEEVGDMQKDLKSSSLSSYMLKPSHLITQVFGKNRTTQ